MQRGKVPAGQISLRQWRAIARLAQRLTPDYPLHAPVREFVADSEARLSELVRSG